MSNPLCDHRPHAKTITDFFRRGQNAKFPIELDVSDPDHGNENWTEAMLARHGMPPNWVSSISAEAQYPFQGKLASGFLTAQRCVLPRKAARNIFRESRSLETGVMTEFSGRLPNYL
jgi:hypothetical protein